MGNLPANLCMPTSSTSPLLGSPMPIRVWDCSKKEWMTRKANFQMGHLILYPEKGAEECGDEEFERNIDIKDTVIVFNKIEARYVVEVRKVVVGYFYQSERLVVTLSGVEDHETALWLQCCVGQSQFLGSESPDEGNPIGCSPQPNQQVPSISLNDGDKLDGDEQRPEDDGPRNEGDPCTGGLL
mmetsp:Transcript_28191/g.43990  ORF Transcript_28191/g.43990 Transcript_28191/m.43990 type:complete len:184 (+) Transcript_28191:183-734(+)